HYVARLASLNIRASLPARGCSRLSTRRCRSDCARVHRLLVRLAEGLIALVQITLIAIDLAWRWRRLIQLRTVHLLIVHPLSIRRLIVPNLILELSVVDATETDRCALTNAVAL